MTENGSQKTFSKHARVRARRSAVQALYQWEMTHAPVAQVIAEFIRDRSELKKADVEYFTAMLEGATGRVAELDTGLAPLLDRPVQALDPVERAILRLGMYELLCNSEVPWRVVVNESVELARMFGAEQSYKYINGVLDKAARRLRSAEIRNVS
ncbi:MAG: transcription antitermination factor NusB [Gammaproteobacteria bacterium]